MSTSSTEDTALVVFESMFDNTAHVAEAIAQGLELGGMRVTVVNVASAPPLDTIDADLLVVGAPTHAFSLSRPSTRDDAVRQGASPTAPGSAYGSGSRPARPHPAAARGSRPSSTPASARCATSRPRPPGRGVCWGTYGFTLVERPTGFLVDDVTGPLLDGETDRALSWGLDLAQAFRRHTVGLTSG